MTKRLFIFAAYDSDNIIDNTVLHYLRALSVLGDIIFIMDSDVSSEQLSPVNAIQNVLHASAARHGEYDFGSYKRGYKYALDNKLLDNYDWVYLVNDSVYGPLFDLKPILLDLESRGVDLTGMVDFKNAMTPVQVQSWFVGLSRRVATSDFIQKFMRSVCSQENKQLIVLKYEVGLSQIVLRHGYKMSTYIAGQDGEVCHEMYFRPLNMLASGVPFVKKAGLSEINGLQYLYPYTTEQMVQWIYEHARRTGLPMAIYQNRHPYMKCFRMTLFSIPIVTIKCQRTQQTTTVSYKVYIFDRIPILKISC